MNDKQKTAVTPKEKASELINKMYYTQSSPTNWVQAKQCALIAADEIVNELEGTNSTKQGGFFWQEVKQEIEKL